MNVHGPVDYHQLQVTNARRLNAAIWKAYQALKNDSSVRRSHFFEGRYENIYIDQALIPALDAVLDAAREGAQSILGTSCPEPRTGFWFNEMAPGELTLPHHHDEDDELLSAVYYVRVPPDSGQLVLGHGARAVSVTPVEGGLVYFPPDVVHEVTPNRSSAVRLSIGMNFGPPVTSGTGFPVPETR